MKYLVESDVRLSSKDINAPHYVQNIYFVKYLRFSNYPLVHFQHWRELAKWSIIFGQQFFHKSKPDSSAFRDILHTSCEPSGRFKTHRLKTSGH